MSYYVTHQALGATSIVGAAASAIEDPCLPQLAASLVRLRELEARKPVSRPPGSPAPVPAKGIGLCQALPAVKLFVAYKERPWVVGAGVVGAIAGVFFLGYLTGRP